MERNEASASKNNDLKTSTTKGGNHRLPPFIVMVGQACERIYLLFPSSDTLSFVRPLARRAARILRPLGVDILSLKPCLFLLFLCDG